MISSKDQIKDQRSFLNIPTTGVPNSMPLLDNTELPKHLRYQYSFEIQSDPDAISV